MNRIPLLASLLIVAALTVVVGCKGQPEATAPPPPEVVAQQPTHVAERARQRSIADHRIGPDVLEEFLLGDRTIAMPNQVGEQLEWFQLDCERLPPLAELTASLVEFEVAEREDGGPVFHDVPDAARPIVAHSCCARARIRSREGPPSG